MIKEAKSRGQKPIFRLVEMMCMCNPITQETQAQGAMNARILGYIVGFRPARAIEQDPPKTNKQKQPTHSNNKQNRMKRKGKWDK